MDITNRVIVIQDFLSLKDCLAFEKNMPMVKRLDGGSLASPESSNVKHPEIVKIIEKIDAKVFDLFSEMPLKKGTYICLYFQPGEKMRVHIDDMFNETNEILNCVVYTTNPLFYTGGTVYFPTLGIEIKPNQGSAIFFDPKLPHGVKEIIDGDRFGITYNYLDAEKSSNWVPQINP